MNSYALDYSTARNETIEVAVDFKRSERPVKYRFLDDFTGDGWQSSPYQTADVQNLNTRQVLQKINEWLEGQS